MPDGVRDVAESEITVWEALVYLFGGLLALKVVVDSVEFLPVGFESRIDDILETAFTPFSVAADYLFD
jgi:hypothetical protein